MDDKNYLGLGVIFRAVDDGYTKKIDKAVKKAQSAQKILNNVGSVDVSGATQKFSMKEPKNPFAYSSESINSTIKYQEAMGKASQAQERAVLSSDRLKKSSISIATIFRRNMSAVGGLGKALLAFSDPLHKVLAGTGKVSDLAKQLDTVQTKMSIIFNADQAKAFNNQLISAVRNYGLSAEQVGDVAKGLTQWGVSIDSSNKMLPFMSKMIASMDMDASAVAEMFGATTQRLGMSVEGAQQLTSEIFAMGQEHGIMDMLEDMPSVVKGVTDSFNRMGIYNTKAAVGTIKQTMALSAMYQKMGINQKQAIEGAKKVQSGVSSMITDIRRMQVGLDPEDFEGMIDVAAELSRTSGMGFEDTMALMQKGPKAVQEEMMKLSKNLSENDRFRLGEIMGKKFGDEFGLALKSDQAQKAAETAGKKLTSTGEKAADKMNKAMNSQMSTFEKQEKVLEANTQLVKALGELLGKKEIIDGWQSQVKALQSMQDNLSKLMKFLSIFESSGLSGFMDLAGVLGGGLKALMIAGKAIGAIIPILSTMKNTLVSVVKSVVDIFTTMSRSGKVLVGRFGGAFKMFGKIATKALGPIGAALGFVMDAIDAFKEKSIGGGIATLLFGKDPAKSVAGVGAAVAGQAMKWGGLGATIGTFVAPGIGTAIGGAIGAALGAAASLIKTYWGDIAKFFSGIGEKLSGTWTSIIDGLKSAFSSSKEWVSKIWASLSESVGGFFSGIVDGIKSKFAAVVDFIKDIFSSAMKWIGDFIGSIPGFSTLMEKAGKMFSSSDSKAGTPQGEIKTLQAQDEAPKLSRTPKYEPKFKEKDSGNTLDDVVKALVDVRNMIQANMGQPTPVQIVLEADAKKLLKIVRMESGDRVSLSGMSNAMGG